MSLCANPRHEQLKNQLNVHLCFLPRTIAQPKPCTYPTPTRESTSCCLSRCSTATALTLVSSSARGSKSSPSHPKRSSPSKMQTVSFHVFSLCYFLLDIFVSNPHTVSIYSRFHPWSIIRNNADSEDKKKHHHKFLFTLIYSASIGNNKNKTSQHFI